MRSPDENTISSVKDVFPEQFYSYAKDSIEYSVKLLSESVEKYNVAIRFGQVVIWEEVLAAFLKMTDLRNRIHQVGLIPNIQRYAEVKDDLSKILTLYASMQGTLTDLEDILGVDRFLDRVSEETFVVLNEILAESKKYIEDKCEPLKNKFIEEWNTTNVFDAITHKLIDKKVDNQICDQLTGSCQQVILFVIDGLGYCQYLWKKSVATKFENYTFDENIFNWLNKTNSSKELILGSSYITDTAAGLAQIFLGDFPRVTGIISSKVHDRTSSANFIATKSISVDDFNQMFYCNNSITDVVSSCGYDTKVYYCSRYQSPPSGFSNSIFKSGNVEQILPPERVFSVVLDAVKNGMDSGLQVIYLTGIDNLGHTTGAYSAFEKYEHLKIDKLLRNFLIELAFNFPKLARK